MPKLYEPPERRPQDVQLALDVLGSSPKGAIVRELAKLRQSDIGRLTEATALHRNTIRVCLREMELAGIVKADVEGPRTGRAPRYSLNIARLRQIHRAWIEYALPEPESESD